MDPMYADYAWEQAAALLAVDSPSGYTEKAALFVQKAFEDLGFPVRRTQKGGVLVDLGGKDEQNALLLEAHTDTLGAIVAEIKSTGRLALSPLGGMSPQNAEAENLRVHTRSGKIVEGTLQLCNASIHVNGDYQKTERTWETVEAVLDEPVTGLDPATTDELYALIRRLNRECGVAIVMVSHDLRGAMQDANKVLVVDRGVSFYGTADEYRKKCAGERT